MVITVELTSTFKVVTTAISYEVIDYNFYTWRYNLTFFCLYFNFFFRTSFNVFELFSGTLTTNDKSFIWLLVRLVITYFLLRVCMYIILVYALSPTCILLYSTHAISHVRQLFINAFCTFVVKKKICSALEFWWTFHTRRTLTVSKEFFKNNTHMYIKCDNLIQTKCIININLKSYL